ncbi:Na+/H+ antiporter NhaA [Herbiconiux sp. 11R-BC]|uniref:Na+/H+ antiporter NhaA n=1 Tax=Herbiconiux sp. 11R-BC TaxID=3111637 RepID=UPI003C061F79
MGFIRSERVAAVLLLAAAALGLVAANTGIGPALMQLQDAHLAIPGTSLDLSVGHWISDGLLAVFFFVVAVELKNEFTVGQLNSVSKAVRPAIAAIGGVAVPAVLYLVITAGSGYEGGWPIPTATDIAFALGVLAVFGKGIPSRLRIFILALAILDDIVAILIIAVFFTANPNLLMLALAVVGVIAFALLSRLLGPQAFGGRFRMPAAVLMVVVALLTWSLVYLSGVHATIAGVALGLAMVRKPALHVRHALEPWTNGVILPLFAFSAALVAIPQVSPAQLAPAFWGILIALPVGKLIGITLGGWLSSFVGRRRADATGSPRPQLSLQGLVTAGALGGVGFTVSLLMNELAFASSPEVADEGTLAVLLGSAVSIVLAAILVSRLAAYYRRLRELRLAAEAARAATA